MRQGHFTNSPIAVRRRVRAFAPGLIATAILALAFGAAAAGAGPRAERRAAGEAVTAPRQPVADVPAPASERSLPSGRATISPTTLVVGEPGQELRVRLDFERPTGYDSVVATLRGPLPSGRDRERQAPAIARSRGTAALETGGAGPGAALELVLPGLNPAAGRYRLELIGQRRGEAQPLARATVLVRAQHRLPPGAATASIGRGEDRPASAAGQALEAGSTPSNDGPEPNSAPLPSGPEPSSAAAGAPEPLAAPSGAEVNHNVNAEPGSQAEAFVALEPDNPDRLIAAIGPSSGNPKAWISDDGMAPGSQVERQLPSTSQLHVDEGGATTNLNLCCEPALAADSNGNLWHAVTSTGASSHIAINRVAAGGTTFHSTNAAIPRGSAGLQEQPMIAIDNGASAKAGRLYVAWIENGGGAQDVVISECDTTAGSVSDPADECDDPDNWSSPTTVTDAGGSGAFASPDVGVAPNGDVYVAWWHVGPPGVGANQIEIDKCAVGGDNDCDEGGDWGTDGAVRDLDVMAGAGLPFFCPIIGAPGGRVGPQPYVEVGPSGTVFVAFSDLRDNAAPSKPTRCTATGTDKTWDSYVVAGAAANTAPTTAEAPVRLSDDGALDLNDHFFAALTVDASNGDVEASLYSTKHDPSGQRTHQYHVISTDSGGSFSGMTQFSTLDSRFSGSLSDGVDYGSYSGADSADGTFVPSWTDNRFIQGRQGDLYVLSPQVETTIDSGPTGTVPTAINSFTFSSPAAAFQCATDSVVFLECTSATSVGPLINGPHTFRVRATDAVGNPVDLSPASATWTINDTDPPQTKITKRPDNKTRKRRATHKFEADEVGATFECRYDRRKWKTCKSPRKKRVDPGKHRFKVRATDVGGNRDPSAAKDTWRFKKKCNKKKAGKPRKRCRRQNKDKHF